MEFRFHGVVSTSRDHSNFTPRPDHVHHPAFVALASPPALTTTDYGDIRNRGRRGW